MKLLLRRNETILTEVNYKPFILSLKSVDT